MADIGPQRFLDPIQVQPPQVHPASAGASTSVLPPFQGNWERLLPQAPSLGEMNSGAQLGIQMRQEKLREQGRNALAQLYQNPDNVDANGALKSEAMRSLAAAGFPEQMLSVMSTQSELQQHQRATAAANQKLQSDWQKSMIETCEPATAVYEGVKKKTGSDEAAQTAAQAKKNEILND